MTHFYQRVKTVKNPHTPLKTLAGDFSNKKKEAVNFYQASFVQLDKILRLSTQRRSILVQYEKQS